MTKEINASASGTFKVGGDIKINRLGFGAMRVTGEGVWGEAKDRTEAIRTLKRLPELGVNFIDTADAYGPETSENMLTEALYPFKGLLIATKGGLVRGGPGTGAGAWAPVGRPEYLRQAVLMSLRRLKVERIDLWQLHRIDPKTPRDEQFAALRDMQKEGLIRHLGLSEVTIGEIEAARKFFPVATVQNQYNLVHRVHEDVLDYCGKNNIGFMPWFPLAAGDLAKPGSILDKMAQKLGATPSQVALAWILKRSPVMLPIPGTGKVRHLEENVAAASIKLSDADFKALDEAGNKEARARAA